LSAVFRDPPDPWPALQSLWSQVTASNPFYRNKFGTASPPPGSLAQFRSDVPFTTKAELVADQALHPPYGTNRSEPLEHYTRCHQTSGTTGAPLRWLDTPAGWEAMVGDWTEVLRQAGVKPGDRALIAFSFGPFLGFWLAFEAAQRLGALCLAGGGMSTALRARILHEHACTVLCATPTYALHLAESFAQQHPDAPSPVRLVVVAGEPGGSVPAIRARLAAAWPGARIFDHHGMTEVGPVTHEDPDHPGRLVVLESAFFAEVVDPTSGTPLPEDAEGELVLTTLHRPASPLIRYRTGDLVRSRRLAGRLVLEGGILGRTDDMVIIRGVNVYPAAVDQIIRSQPGAGEYRVTVDPRGALPELAVEVEGGPLVAAAVEEGLKNALSLRVPVTSVPPGHLPRFELKARRWHRLDR
jgi:phenylacetate-CoA ligase